MTAELAVVEQPPLIPPRLAAANEQDAGAEDLVDSKTRFAEQFLRTSRAPHSTS